MGEEQGRASRGDVSPQYFSRGDDNAFITANIGRNCYAIAIKHSMSGDGWQEYKSMLSIEEMIKQIDHFSILGPFFDFSCCNDSSPLIVAAISILA